MTFSRDLTRVRLSFARTALQAFPQTVEYASCLERPLPSLWRRILQAIKECCDA